MTIALAPELEYRLQNEAARNGQSPDQFAANTLIEKLESAEQERRQQAIALLQSWIDDGDEAEQKESWEYLVKALDEDRLSDRKLFPAELKGVSW